MASDVRVYFSCGKQLFRWNHRQKLNNGDEGRAALGLAWWPSVRTLYSLLRSWVQFLVRELRSHKPSHMTEKNQKTLSCVKQVLGGIMVLFSEALPSFTAVALGVPPWNSRAVVPSLFGTRDWFCERQFFHGPRVGGGWFGDDSSPSHLLFTLFLL